MRSINLLLLLVFIGSCNTTNSKNTNGSSALQSKSDTSKRLERETVGQLARLKCICPHPDTSLSGILIRDTESATKIIGENSQLDSVEQYHFYTKLNRETLTLVQQPGDYHNQISVFRVEYSDKTDRGYRQLAIDTLMTENGIKLGLSKKQIVRKLGTCYFARDSSVNYLELCYRIELPNDTKTNLLMRHHMPVYYASYKLWNDQLEAFEFGFEYP